MAVTGCECSIYSVLSFALLIEIILVKGRWYVRDVRTGNEVVPAAYVP